jgi:predicted ferric reductase
MSLKQSTKPPFKNQPAARSATWSDFPFGWLFLALASTGLLIAGLVLAAPFSAGLRDLLAHLLALDTSRATWYITRSAGITAYLFLWLSTAWGLALPTKLFDGWLGRAFIFDFHQFISLLALGFLGLHIVVLSADSFMPYSLAQLLVPFLSPYRPLWVSLGSLAFYLSLLVTVTFYLRQRIGQKMFRAIHMSSLLAYLGATLHGLMSGTDSALPAVWLLYLGSFLIVVFLTAYWLITRRG